jgi:hypothetical protein
MSTSQIWMSGKRPRVDGYLQEVKIAPRRALFIDDEKAALDVPFEDPVPHYQGPAFTERVPEAHPLSC